MSKQIMTSQNQMSISKEDAYILRRIIAKKSTSGAKPSALLRPWLHLLSGTPDQRKLAIESLQQSHLLTNVMHIDPDQTFEEYLNDYKKTFPILTLEELEGTPLPHYATDRYAIYSSGFNVLYGTPGIGKSLIAVDFMGRWSESNDGLMLYVSAEGRASFGARFNAWKHHHKGNLKHIGIWDEMLNIADLSTINRLAEAIKEYNIKFVVFDTLADVMVGADENSTRDMNFVVHQFEQLRRDTECGILIIHHTNKIGELRGSTTLLGKADSVLKATLADADNTIALYNALDKGGKNRHNKEADALHLRRLTITMTYRGQLEELPVLELSENVSTDLNYNALSSKQKAILETLDGYDGLNVKALQNATGIAQSTLYDNLKKLMRANYVTHRYELDQYSITDKGRDAYLNS